MTTSIRSGTNESALQINGSDAVPFNSGGTSYKIQSVSASVATNALTVGLNPCVLHFRNGTLTNGAPLVRNVNSAISLVIPSGATLGTINAIAARLILIAIDAAGVVELAIVNIAGGTALDESGVISTTAISAASTANNVIYSTTARTNVSYRVVGFVDITEATAGTWATAPSLVQGTGGQALTALSSLGYGQTWQAVTRTSGVTYYNTTGKPLFIHIRCNWGSSSTGIVIGGVDMGIISGNGTAGANFSSADFIVPSGNSYVITDLGTNGHVSFELR